MNFSEHARLEITKESLPPKFQNEITENADLVTIRSNVKSMADINEWVKEFGVRTNTKWNSRDSCPSGEKFVCRKKFVCRHSSFCKVPAKENKKGNSKNTDCLASVTVKIKLNNMHTRAKDEFTKKGLVGVITVSPFHNHSLMSVETLKFLPAEDCKLVSEDHSYEIMGKLPFDEENLSASESLLVTESNPSENSIQANNNCRKKELSERLVELFRNALEKFDVSEPALEMAVQHLEKISCKRQLETMLATLGNNADLKKNS